MSDGDLPDSLPERFSTLLGRLDAYAVSHALKRPRRGHGDSYTACCPSHHDKNPSLALRLEGDRILAHCFAGCDFEDVLGAVGFPAEAAFSDWNGASRGGPSWRFNGTGAAPVPSPSRPGHGAGQLDGEWRLPMPPSVREFLDLEFPPSEPLLGPIGTQQICILYAPTGVGKTMFALAIAWAIASGVDFVGWASARPAKVLVVDGEMAGEMMQARLAGAGHDNLYVANLPNWAAANGYEPVNLCEPAGGETVNVWAGAIGAEVIILDNLMSLAWIQGVSMNSDEFWQPIRQFAVWQRSMGRTVIVVDHTNKSGELHGTGTKVWHADLAMRLGPIESPDPTLSHPVPPTRFSLAFSKVRGTRNGTGQETEEKVITLGAVGQDWAFEAGKEEKQRRAREMALNGLTIRDIAEELGAPRSTVGRWVKGYLK